MTMPPVSATASSALPFSRERFFRDYLGGRLKLFEAGSLTVVLPNGRVIQHSGSRPGPSATILVKRWRLLWKLLSEGEIGLARSYVDGDWSSPDLAAVLEFGLANEKAISVATKGFGLAHALNRVSHFRNSNTRRGSRRNIAAHYDLGNAFYSQWLDPELIYSSAIFEDGSESLEAAQDRKLTRIVELMEIEGGERVLEIGCGWGSLARKLAASGSGSVTGISLSQEQIAHARESLADLPQAPRIEFELRDYRSVAEQYDRIVSIEMIEAVGERYWPVYFEKLRRSLKDDGSVVLQIISISEDLYDSYRQRPDFIQRYIFPGGMLPTVEIVKEQATRAGFQIDVHQPFGDSYAKTLDIWHERFNANWDQIAELGFDDRFRRMWNYYLKYCSTGFRHGAIDVGLFKLTPVRGY